jgi:hypothetical protein
MHRTISAVRGPTCSPQRIMRVLVTALLEDPLLGTD